MDELHCWLRLAHTPNVGPVTVNALIKHFHEPSAVFAANRSALRNTGLTNAIIARLSSRVDAELEAVITAACTWQRESVNHIVHLHDERYPALLKQIPDPPTVLYVSGDPEVLSTPSVAIVGSRQSAVPALETTDQIAQSLAARGITITSGLAQGIDFAAHKAALFANGLTIAVAGTGLDRVYPARHRALAQEITECGALISEFPLGCGPLPHHFPRRNRIISGLSIGVVVIEAALRSGSLITAKHAAEQGREVLVVPGSVNNPLSKGCHHLIRSGATLVQTADDILTEIAAQIDTDPRITSGSSPNPDRDMDRNSGGQETGACLLLDCLGYEPTTVDTLIGRTGQPASAVTTMLLKLEMEGRVTSISGGRYIRC